MVSEIAKMLALEFDPCKHQSFFIKKSHKIVSVSVEFWWLGNASSE
jgi:hypothetical protein